MLALVLVAVVHAHLPRVPVLEVAPKTIQGEVMIRSWRMVGPFPVSEEQLKIAERSNGTAGLDRDCLAGFGFREDTIGPSEFARLTATPGDLEEIKNIPVNSEGELIELTKYFEFGEYGIAYAAAQIDSASDAELAMLCSNTYGIKVWLNHENVLTTGYSTGAQKFQHALRVKTEARQKLPAREKDRDYRHARGV